MKLISTLLATTAIANAAVVFDTRIYFDFNTGPGEGPNITYDNTGAAISFDIHEFGPQTFYMNVYNEVERSQYVTSIDFSVDSRIAVKSAEFYTGEALDGKGGDGGEVEGRVLLFDDRAGRYDVSFDLRSPGTTDSSGAEHSGGTSFTVLWEFDEPTTTAEFLDAFFHDDWTRYGIEVSISASVMDFSSRVDDVNDLTDHSFVSNDQRAWFLLAGTVVPEPSSAMLAFLGLLPILRRNRK